MKDSKDSSTTQSKDKDTSRSDKSEKADRKKDKQKHQEQQLTESQEQVGVMSPCEFHFNGFFITGNCECNGHEKFIVAFKFCSFQI